MSVKVLLIVLLAGLSAQQCATGCLKCSADNRCLICDVTSSYFLNGTACALSTQTNCNILAQNGACVQCNTNFYIDANTFRCVAVPSASLVANCRQFSNAPACVACAGNFYLSGGACVPVNVTIANCLSYTSAQLCVGCATNFIPSADYASCVALPVGGNCQLFNYIGCRACKAGFFPNSNYYLVQVAPADTLAAFYQLFVNPNWNTWGSLGQCQAVTALNCATLSAFDTCAACNFGFYLLNGRCVAYPAPMIANCLTYSSLTACTECQPGFFLLNNACSANVAIANCLAYDGTASATTCKACLSGAYLSQNTCLNRTASLNIANCANVSVAADTCAACNSGFILTTDSLACLAQIANCATYAASSLSSTALTCQTCAAGYYLTTSGSVTTCTQGTVANCRLFASGANTCLTCVNGYYLNNLGACVAHVAIANCATYSAATANVCDACNAGYYNFNFDRVCSGATAIANCATYTSDGSQCSACAAGFYLASATSCLVIPVAFPNCAQYSGSACTQCNAGYMLDLLVNSGKCVVAPDYLVSSASVPCYTPLALTSGQLFVWASSVSGSQVAPTCTTCGDYRYGVKPHRAEAICVNTTQLAALYSGYSAVANCARYGYNYASPATLVCMQCASGYFLTGYEVKAELSTATACSSVCALTATNSNAVLVDDMLGFVNVCIAYSNAGTNFFQPDGICTRYARTTLATFGANNEGTDYDCLSTVRGTGTYPTNLVAYDSAYSQANGAYKYEQPLTTGVVTPVVSGPGLPNFSSSDASQIVPTVFNYLGTLASRNQGMMVGVVASTTRWVIDDAKLKLNSLSNCDIIGFLGNTAYTSALPGANAFSALTSGNSYAFCFRCAWGYQNVFTGGLAQASTSPFPSCTSFGGSCDTTKFYGGLPQHLNTILSCHVCTAVNGVAYYPTFHVETGGNGNIVGFASADSFEANLVDSKSVLKTNNGFKCLPAPAQIVTAAAGTLAAIDNCRVYAYFRAVTIATGALNAAAAKPICVACAANYWPTYLGAPGVSNTIYPNWIVTGCTQGANCDYSITTQFNACGKCKTSDEALATPIYYAFLDLTLSNCLSVKSQNCLVAATYHALNVNTNPSDCSICKAGFFLNADVRCEQLRVPNQAVANGGFYKAYAASQIAPTGTAAASTLTVARAHYLLSLNQLQYGVSACDSGYTFAPTSPLAPTLCAWSSHVYTAGAIASSTAFIKNCIRYQLIVDGNGLNLCDACAAGYIIQQDHKACVANTNLGNCTAAQTADNTLCYQCAANFYNVLGKCVRGTIANCATYASTQTSVSSPAVLTCATCTNGFVLAGDALSCSVGQVRNCVSYTQNKPLECTACAANFVLMSLNSVFYCYPIDASLNCAALDATTAANSGAAVGTITCTSCNYTAAAPLGIKSWSALNQAAAPQTLCMLFSPIANCLAYDQSGAAIKANTFGCSSCATGFWYNAANFSCVARLVQPAQCSTYDKTSDTCSACAAGFFLASDKKSCVAFPTGVIQCRVFSSATTCASCNSGYFLANNTCTLSFVVANCAAYSANNTCSACAAGYFLANATSCVAATAVNCLNYTSTTACGACAAGFGLLTTNGVTSCVSNSLSNCVSATTVAPFQCLTCAAGFYPLGGNCTAVSLNIPYCLVYDSPTTCSVCASNSVLNVARTVCNATAYLLKVDQNCNENYLLTNPSCSQCAAGYVFSNNACVACANNTYSSGCLYCSPDAGNACLICRPSFSMNAQGNCVANSATPAPTPSPTPNNTGSAVAKFAGVALAMAAVYFDWA